MEEALVALARKSCESPGLLVPADLEPVMSLAGDGALEYTLVLSAFHFINRIADLLDVDPEALPAPQRRFEPLRRLSVRITSRFMRRMDLRNRAYPRTFEEATDELVPLLGAAAYDGADAVRAAFEPARPAPWVVEAVKHAICERDRRSSLDGATIARIHAVVEDALPCSTEEATGFHPRPADPVDAYAFVGTRYAYRVTEEMIAALRRSGFDDLSILDLAIAIADANQWARMYRLLGLPPDLFYLESDREAARSVVG
ncbi:MAG: hypothetical protein E4H00_10595 [Myxococcales bacterium]|nr:MAG: hypothetical protein E4H00_10595 [Myxococcales bacterium]